MSRRTQLAAQQRLKRERGHLQWLEQHFTKSTQLSSSKKRIAALAAQCAVFSDSKQKKRCSRTAHQSHSRVEDNISEQAEDR